MTGSGDIAAEAARIDRLYAERAATELDAADLLARGSDAVRFSGDAPADVLLVKGAPGPEDRAGKRALAGPDGEAIGKALDALALSPLRCAVCSRVGGASVAAHVRRLRLIVESVDPRVVIALDPTAAADLSAAFGVGPLEPGCVTRVLGRDMLATDDFAASLADERAKRRAWGQLQALRRAPSA